MLKVSETAPFVSQYHFGGIDPLLTAPLQLGISLFPPLQSKIRHWSKASPNQVLLVQNYGPKTTKIQSLTANVNRVIARSDTWATEPRVLEVVNRRGRHLGDLILRTKQCARMQFEKQLEGTQMCTPLKKPNQEKEDAHVMREI